MITNTVHHYLVLILFFLSILIIITARGVISRKKPAIYSSKKSLLYYFYLLHYFCIGFVSFGIPSAIQKAIIGVSLHMRGFLVPLIIGGAFGTIIGKLFYNLKQKNSALEETITRLQQYEEEKKVLSRQLEHAQQMEAIGTLAGGIAHDFNNTLLPIIGYSDLLIGTLPKESRELEMVKAISQAGIRARDLTRQVLQFSRQAEPEIQVFNLNEILAEVMELSRAAIPAEIELILDVEGDGNFILASPSQIHQVCMNLITNAYHALPQDGGTIKIKLNRYELSGESDEHLFLQEGKYLKLTVSDNGCGIPPEIREKVLEPYFTTKEAGKGTGMGLSIAYGIVKNMGGYLFIESEVGSGSDMILLLPRAADNAAEKLSEEKKNPSGQGKILLIDDETMIADLLSKMLQALGYETVSITDSRKALELIKNRIDCYDLILTDISMPGLTGLDLASEIRKVNHSIPIVLSTGFSDKLNKEKRESLRISGVLMKPYKMNELADMMNKLLA